MEISLFVLQWNVFAVMLSVAEKLKVENSTVSVV
jgi:hypothetical protein